MAKSKVSQLTNMLLDEAKNCGNGKQEIARLKAIGYVGRIIVKTAILELEYNKHLGKQDQLDLFK